MDDKHSKEPWRPSPKGDAVITDDAEHCRHPCTTEGHQEYYGGNLVCESVGDADARRICAAVNAVEGIPTDELEMLARAGKRLTAHAEAQPTADEDRRYGAFLRGYWTSRPPTAPGLYLVVDLAGDRCTVNVTEREIAERVVWTWPWRWSVPLYMACLTPPSLRAVAREGDGSAHEPVEG